MKGIDVSTFQGYPEWNKVKNSGIDFAMIKATQGRAESSSSYLFTDSKFKYNITNAPAVGIKCGVYHYLTAVSASEAVREAEYFIKAITPYRKQIALYAAVDVESKYISGLSKTMLTAIVKRFCETVKTAGFIPIVYTNPSWLKTRLDGIGDNFLWLALWRNIKLTPTGYKKMMIWQHGASKVDGIRGDVDSNYGYFNTADIDEFKPEPAAVVTAERESIKVGDTVRVENPVNYDTGNRFGLYYPAYTVMQIVGKRAVIGVNGDITAAVHVNYIEKV